jgi:hypothetical protein
MIAILEPLSQSSQNGLRIGHISCPNTYSSLYFFDTAIPMPLDFSNWGGREKRTFDLETLLNSTIVTGICQRT